MLPSVPSVSQSLTIAMAEFLESPKQNILLVGLTLISHDVTAISGTHADPLTS
jgi:hypothetical protein